MRIAHTAFSVNSSSGGIGPVVQGVTSALHKLEDIETTTYVPKSGYLENFTTPIKTFSCFPPSHHCISPTLINSLVKDQIDLIHCHGIWTFLARNNLKWVSAGKPCMISLHGMTMPVAMKFSRWKKMVFWPLLEKANLSRASSLHSLSCVETESIRAIGVKTPIIQIGNGVHLPEQVTCQQSNTEANGGVRSMLYLGRIHPIKGLNKLIEAWVSCQDSNLASNWKLQIVGWGENEHVQEFERQIKDIKSIRFSGPLFGQDKHLAMNQASAFVLPSSSEAFPMALMEAWSHGLPAIATHTCNVFGVRGGGAAVFVDDSADCIRDGIMNIIEMSNSQRQTMGGRARSIVEEDYSWPIIAAKFVSVYRWLLGDGPEPTELLFD